MHPKLCDATDFRLAVRKIVFKKGLMAVKIVLYVYIRGVDWNIHFYVRRYALG